MKATKRDPFWGREERELEINKSHIDNGSREAKSRRITAVEVKGTRKRKRKRKGCFDAGEGKCLSDLLWRQR